MDVIGKIFQWEKFEGSTFDDYMKYCQDRVNRLEAEKRFWEKEIDNKKYMMKVFKKKLSDKVI